MTSGWQENKDQVNNLKDTELSNFDTVCSAWAGGTLQLLSKKEFTGILIHPEVCSLEDTEYGSMTGFSKFILRNNYLQHLPQTEQIGPWFSGKNSVH